MVKQIPAGVAEEGCRLLSPTSHDAPARINKVNVLLLLLAASFYDAAVSGAVDILNAFVLKEPLSWTAAQVSLFLLTPQQPASLFDLVPLPLQVGYGNAAGCMIFFTSFLGLLLFRRCMNDVMLILIGMISFASGIFFMTFVRTTTTFYLGRTLLDFSFQEV